MAKISGIDILALTDHNSTKNCPAFFEAAKKHAIIPIAGMELTTAEDIHVVCLFEALEDAMRFDEFVDKNRIKFKNKPQIFGYQQVLDGEDKLLYQVEDLLINATSISISDVLEITESFGGVCYPAHIDRESNGIISVLGTLPEDIAFNYYELNERQSIEQYSKKYNIPKDRFIISSDSHYLTDIRDKENFFLLNEESDESSVVKELFEILRRPRQ